MSTAAGVLVVGAGVAGFTVVTELRRGGYAAPLVLVGDEPDPPYDRPPLSKHVLAGQWPASRTALAHPGEFADLDIEVVLGRRAVRLQPDSRTVHFDDGSVRTGEALVIATGSAAVLPRWARLGPRVHVLRTLADAEALAQQCVPGARLVVVGTGFLGLEAASVARSLGVDVVVVGPLEPMLPAVGAQVSARLRALHTEHGVRFDIGAAVEQVIQADAGVLVRTNTGSHEADLVLLALGARPQLEWLADSGLPMTAQGVLVDDRGRVCDGIHAAGEVAFWPDAAGVRRTGDHRLTATEQAHAVVADLLGRPAPGPIVSFWWSEQYDVRLQAYGHPDGDAEQVIVHGAGDAARFVVAYRCGDHVCGVLGWNAPKQIRAARSLVTEAVGWPPQPTA